MEISGLHLLCGAILLAVLICINANNERMEMEQHTQNILAREVHELQNRIGELEQQLGDAQEGENDDTR
jgi:hypothetical protein